MSEVKTLGEALPAEMKYVRETVIPIYQEIGSAGSFAIAMINRDLSRAEKAMAEGDAVEMLRSYEALKGIKL